MLLKAENLALRYPNGALGIEDVSIEIDEGQIVALIGANGAGKTTTCRALSGVLRTEDMKIVRGKVFFDGVNVTGWEPHRLVKLGISAVPERNKVFPNLSVREHFISAGMHRPRAERDEVIEFGLQLFPRIRDRLGQSAGKLSGGEQQMVAIIRALVNRPRLLIVDEMTLGLHASLQAPLFAALKASLPREPHASSLTKALLIQWQRRSTAIYSKAVAPRKVGDPLTSRIRTCSGLGTSAPRRHLQFTDRSTDTSAHESTRPAMPGHHCPKLTPKPPKAQKTK